MSNNHPIQRFTKTVEYYSKYRPTYPPAVIKTLQSACNLTWQSVIADLGYGTGIFTHILLDHGNKVFGVEPNKAMRLMAENTLMYFGHL